MYGEPRDLHVLTHSFPTRRSSDLAEGISHCVRVAGGRGAVGGGNRRAARHRTGDGENALPAGAAAVATASRAGPPVGAYRQLSFCRGRLQRPDGAGSRSLVHVTSCRAITPLENDLWRCKPAWDY